MSRCSCLGAALLVMIASPLVSAQEKDAKPAELSTPISMPNDRANDSYRIYHSLIPWEKQGAKDGPRKLWIVRDTTMAVIPNELCQTKPSSQTDGASVMMTMNPHVAARPSDDRRQDFAEILDDWTVTAVSG